MRSQNEKLFVVVHSSHAGLTAVSDVARQATRLVARGGNGEGALAATPAAAKARTAYDRGGIQGTVAAEAGPTARPAHITDK